MKINPFFPNDPIPPALFVGRAKEVNTVTKSIWQTCAGKPESVLVIGARGSGKTSLAQYASNLESSSALSEENLGARVFSVFVRCGGMQTIPEFCSACFDKIKQSTEIKQTLWNKLKDVFSEVEVDTGYIKIKTRDPGSNPTVDFARLLKKVWTNEVSKDYGALQIIIDETDDLTNCSTFPGFIKNTIEAIKERPTANIQFVVTVVDDKIKTLIHNHESFPRIFHLVSLSPLVESEVEALVKKCLSDNNGTTAITPDAIQLLKVLTAGIPNYVHQFCHEAFEVDSDNTIDTNDLINGAHGTNETRGSFDILWEKHFKQKYAEDIQSPYKRKILHTLAIFDRPASNGEISSLYKEIFNESPSSNMTVYLTNMVNDGVIKRFGKSSPYMYQITDPRFRVLLRFYPGTNRAIYDRINDYMLSAESSKTEF